MEVKEEDEGQEKDEEGKYWEEQKHGVIINIQKITLRKAMINTKILLNHRKEIHV